jgi:hypothetical protein
VKRLLLLSSLAVLACFHSPERGSETDAALTDADTLASDASMDAGAPDLDQEVGLVGDAALAADATRDSGGPLESDAGPTRPYRLATSGAQLVVSGPELGLQLTEANVADDSDVMAVHQEFYGLPWDAFESGSAPPAEWVSVMDRLASSARMAKKPVFLSLTMLNGKRESLAPKTRIEQGQVKTSDDWSAKCYDFARAADAAQKREAYLRYVASMVTRFQPAYLNIAIEVNLFMEKCAEATPALIDLMNAVYRAVKAQRPETLVFPSFQIDHLYGYSEDSCASALERDACFERAYAAIKPILRDRFAISSYPYLSGFKSTAELPKDWFTRAASRAAETAVIAETGWPSTAIVVRTKTNTCQTYFSFDEGSSAAYLARVLADAEGGPIELVTWWSDRDLLVEPVMTECPCTFDATWCGVLDIFRGPASGGAFDTQAFGELLLKVFGTMGIRHYDGTPKTLHYAEWNAARALPWRAR